MVAVRVRCGSFQSLEPVLHFPVALPTHRALPTHFELVPEGRRGGGSVPPQPAGRASHLDTWGDHNSSNFRMLHRALLTPFKAPRLGNKDQAACVLIHLSWQLFFLTGLSHCPVWSSQSLASSHFLSLPQNASVLIPRSRIHHYSVPLLLQIPAMPAVSPHLTQIAIFF